MLHVLNKEVVFFPVVWCAGTAPFFRYQPWRQVQEQLISVACCLLYCIKSCVLFTRTKKAPSCLWRDGSNKGLLEILLGKSEVTKKDHLCCGCRALAPEQLFPHSAQSKINVPGFCKCRNTHHRAISSKQMYSGG